MRYIFIILFLITLISCSSPPQPLKPLENGKDYEISLTINRAFHDTILISFSYLDSQKPVEVYVAKFPKVPKENYREVKVIAEKSIENDIFLELYNQAFNMDFKNIQEKSGSLGLDGSTWTLKVTKVNSVISLSIWGPTYDTKDRGLNDFLNYCKKLIDLSEVEIPEGEFY